ncbi:MAG: tetratricopeptide repeat protein, partial [Candidatus Poribacteria bacterium]|nr:tetratricopeptide repeat protein [Candidatus Poribacteria bacterium]
MKRIKILTLALIVLSVIRAQVGVASTIDQVQSHFQAASEFVRQERYDDAIHEFREVIKVATDQESIEGALYWIGQCYQRQGKWDGAREAFEELIAKYPNSELVPLAKIFLSQISAK